MSRRPRREVGICKSNGFTAYYAFDQARTLSRYRREGGPVARGPEMIDAEIESSRSSGDPRESIAVIEGGYDFMRSYQDGLRQPDLVVFVSDSETLHRLGVRVLDETWSQDDPQIDLNDYL